MNEVDAQSFEVIKVMITVLNEESGSKATIAKFYKLGAKKNGDKYITIKVIPDFYKRNAKNLVEDAIAIKIDDPMRLRGTLIGGKPKHNERVITSISPDDEVMIYQETNKDNLNGYAISTNWIDDVADKIEVIFPRIPKIIELKISPEYFEAQRSGVKNFEIRKNDRGYRVDDVLWLKEYDSEKKQYTGHALKRKITYITSYKQQEGYVVLGTKKIEESRD